MTTLNTIIEEEKKEFDRRIDSDNYKTEEDDYGPLKVGSDTLLDESWYPESSHEIDGEKVKDFLTTAMQRVAKAERANWLRSEIEKLEGQMKDNVFVPDHNPSPYGGLICRECRMQEDCDCHVYNEALTSIITRYKEELLELDKTSGL